jgi:hypothetical protein
MHSLLVTIGLERERERERVTMVVALATIGFREGENGWCIGDHWIEK